METKNSPTLARLVENLQPEELKTVFNSVCDEYAQRLCEMYDWCYEDGWWVVDLRAGTFCTSDMEYTLSLEDITLLVDYNVPFDEFQKWWDYNMQINYALSNHPNNSEYSYINLYSWIKGYRPTVSKDILDREEKLYWSCLKDSSEPC